MRKFKNVQTGHIINEKDDNFELVVKLPKILIENSKDWVEIFEPKFKNGDFVKNYYGGVIFITDYENEIGYGVDASGIWTSNTAWFFNGFENNWQLATKEEWLEALTKEAKKRYKVGENFISLYSKNNCCISNFKLEIEKEDGNFLLLIDGNCIMENGVWAEVVKEETLDDLAERFYQKYIITKGFNKMFLEFFNENKETINRLSK